jgi:1-acyl-sn-glycerol-3-phosphate acyltransferase
MTADLLRWAACGLFTAPWLSAAAATALVDRGAARRLLHAWCRCQSRLFGLEVTVEDRNHGDYPAPPYLFVQLNQASLCETFALPPTVPVPYAICMNVEYALLPFVGWAHWAIGGVVLVRQWPAQSRRELGRAVERLRRGESLVISIEGARSPDGRLGRYKKGPAVLALESGATIVPIVVRGAGERMPRGQWRVRPGAVHVAFLPPIPTAGMGYADRDRLTARLRALAAEELQA